MANTNKPGTAAARAAAGQASQAQQPSQQPPQQMQQPPAAAARPGSQSQHPLMNAAAAYQTALFGPPVSTAVLQPVAPPSATAGLPAAPTQWQPQIAMAAASQGQQLFAQQILMQQQLPPAPPLPTQDVIVSMDGGRQYSLRRDFFHQVSGMWPLFNTRNPQAMKVVSGTYCQWLANRQAVDCGQSTAQQPLPLSNLQPFASGAQGHHSSSPQQQQAALPRQPPLTAKEQAAASAATLRVTQQNRDAAFPAITRPQDAEEKQFLPKPRLQSVVREACGRGTKLSASAEAAMKAVAEDFVSEALSFGMTMARRRRADVVEPADLHVYFRQTWNIDVPGSSGGVVPQYSRLAASNVHRARLAAVRKGNAAATQKAAAQEAAAAKPNAAAAAVAGAEGCGGGDEANGIVQPQPQRGQKRQRVQADDNMPDIGVLNGV